MPTVTPYVFDGAALTATTATYGTAAPASTRRVIKAATVTNSTAAAVTLTVYMVPQSGAAGAGNIMISARTIAANESYPCPELINQGLNAGGTVQAQGLGLTLKYTALDFT